MPQIEWDFLIPADVTLDANGDVLAADWDEVYSFHDNGERALMSFMGWGMPTIDYITQKGPFQHGLTVIDYRLQPRVVQMVHRRTGGCREDYWDHRALFVNALRPNRGTSSCLQRARLRKVFEDGSKRDLFVMIEKGPSFEPRGSNWDEWSITETIRFIAHDPIIFNPTQQSESWVLDPSSELVFPIAFPIFFGSSILNDTLNVTYDGTWLTYPVITIVGPLNGARIKNNSTDEEIALNFDVPPATTITINLNYGAKTVVDQDGTSYIGSVSSDSDFATFHIAPDPEVADGINELVVEGSNADANTAVTIAWYDKYIGI